MGCQRDQLVGALKEGLGLGSGVCAPMELKKKGGSVELCFHAKGSEWLSGKQKLSSKEVENLRQGQDGSEGKGT